MDDLKQHLCSRRDRDAQYDARGIFLTYACHICYTAKMSRFRPDVLTDSGYWADEPIEPEDY